MIHQSLAAWGPLLTAPPMVLVLCNVGWHLGYRTYMPQVQRALYGAPFFPIQIGLALVIGWVIGGTLPHRTMVWVWAVPLFALCLAFVGVAVFPTPSPPSILFPPVNDLTIAQAVALGLPSRLRHFVGFGVGLQPFNQLVATLPLYSAISYSLGAWLANNVVRAPVFFASMRRVRKARLLLFVVLPWFCLRAVVDWQQAVAQYPALRTWPVLREVLFGLAMASLSVGFIFALVVALVGRRFGLTRFFLAGTRAGASER